MASSFWFICTLATADSPVSSDVDCLNSTPSTPATITRVTDGDTVVLDDGRRVRLIGINTLELNSTRHEDKAWAHEAKTELEKHIQAQAVSLVTGLEEFDRHGRTLAHLKLKDGSSAADALIRQGLGLSIAVGANQRCAEQYEASENLARKAKLGIWKKPGNWFNTGQALTAREGGFRLIQSKVVRVRESENRTALELQNGLYVTMNKYFMPPQSDTNTQGLLGRRVEVRGWLSKESGKQTLTLSHSSNLRVLPY